ncbi:hypothetical protein [Gordonia hongkongensis]|uniref:hypothetical protein n=1 Tax=Gordonia hongkongensis TaxID=1701090 RepID=UPI003D727E04
MTAPTPTARRHTLLDVVELHADAPSGPWSRGPSISDYFDRGFTSVVTDICEPTRPPSLPEVPLGDEVRPFAITGHSRIPTRCGTEAELREAITPLLPRSTEYRVGKYLWHGGGVIADEPHVMHPDVTEVPRSGSPAADLASALSAAYGQTNHLTPVALLGIESALHLALGLQNLALKYVVSPAFPTNGIAILDDNITVTLSPVDVTTATQIDINRIQLEATQLALVEFDVTKGVRVAAS